MIWGLEKAAAGREDEPAHNMLTTGARQTRRLPPPVRTAHSPTTTSNTTTTTSNTSTTASITSTTASAAPRHTHLTRAPLTQLTAQHSHQHSTAQPRPTTHTQRRAMGGWASKPQLSVADEHRLARKCRSLSQAYARCHKANPNDGGAACNNLQTSLVMCYAADLCKEAAAAHEKCYMSVINTGRYKGKMDCEETVNAMKDCLRRYNLYPFSPSL